MSRVFDIFPLELFQPRHHRQGNRHAAVVARSEDEQGLAFALSRGQPVFLLACARIPVFFADHPRFLREPHHIKDERDFTVAHDGCAGESRLVF